MSEQDSSDCKKERLYLPAGARLTLAQPMDLRLDQPDVLAAFVTEDQKFLLDINSLKQRGQRHALGDDRTAAAANKVDVVVHPDERRALEFGLEDRRARVRRLNDREHLSSLHQLPMSERNTEKITYEILQEVTGIVRECCGADERFNLSPETVAARATRYVLEALERNRIETQLARNSIQIFVQQRIERLERSFLSGA